MTVTEPSLAHTPKADISLGDGHHCQGLGCRPMGVQVGPSSSSEPSNAIFKNEKINRRRREVQFTSFSGPVSWRCSGSSCFSDGHSTGRRPSQSSLLPWDSSGTPRTPPGPGSSSVNEMLLWLPWDLQDETGAQGDCVSGFRCYS